MLVLNLKILKKLRLIFLKLLIRLFRNYHG